MMEELISNISSFFTANQEIKITLQVIAVLIIAYFGDILTKKILFSAIKNFVAKTKTKYDDTLFTDKMLKRIALLVPIIIINSFTYLIPAAHEILTRIMETLFVLTVILIISSFLNSLTEFLEGTKRYKDKPIKGYIQVIKIIVYIWGIILLIGIFTNQDPWTIIGGLGALTAVIILVFKDTILSFVASIQISSYDLVKKGDWIEAPKAGADGDVIDISLNVIKVQNWDKTISVIPTYKLIDETFKNWRGMQESGGRRIKRSIFIDQSSIKFLDEDLFNKFSNFYLLQEYLSRKKIELDNYNKSINADTSVTINGRRMTNLGTFREYLKGYLKNREDINKNMTFLVRQLPSGPNGLPIEIYVFANTTEWVDYEEIQASIFDHILAIIGEFELRVFQNPSGHDFKKLTKNL